MQRRCGRVPGTSSKRSHDKWVLSDWWEPGDGGEPVEDDGEWFAGTVLLVDPEG